MIAYGKAFKTIRLIKDIPLEEAADGLGIDKRTLWDIESDETKVVFERFEQMTKFYNIEPEVVFDLALSKATFQNVVHKAQRDGIVVNQGQVSENDVRDKYIALLEKQVNQLSARIITLEESLKNRWPF